MASRIESVREKASGSLEVAVSGGLVFFIDAVDAGLLGVVLARSRGGAVEGGVRYNVSSGIRDTEANATLNLWPQAELSEEEVRVLERLDALRRARFYAVQIAARAEQGTRQMYEKLVHKGFAAEVARAAVSWMCESGYIDDVRYVRMLFMAHSVKRGQGLSRVQQIAWQRVGLFDNQKRIIAEAVGSIEKDDMAKAVRMSAEQILKRATKIDPRSRQEFKREGFVEDPGSSEVMPARRADIRSTLRAHLKRMGFPGPAIDTYLESLENAKK